METDGEFDEEFEELRRVLDAIFEAGPRLDSELRERVVAWEGGDVEQALLDIVLDTVVWRRAARGETYALRHAVDLLVRRGDADEVAEIARLIPELPGGEYAHDEVLMVLSGRRTGAQMDDGCVERLWAVFAEMREVGEAGGMSALLEVFFEQRGPSERLHEAFAETAIREPGFVRMFLEEYEARDEVFGRVADLLEQRGSLPEEVKIGVRGLQDIREMLEEVGADVPGWLDKKIAEERQTEKKLGELTGRSVRGRKNEETFVKDDPDVGRNDPCPCGSGRKYKRCCG